MNTLTPLHLLGAVLCLVAITGWLLLIGWRQASATDRLESKRRAPLSPEAQQASLGKLRRVREYGT